ncbi:substrate-binding domain-containing protein [Vibrio sp. Of14-4]|uniref:substrate-binding domain-containing protein n=1 Tax=Vibrio sp. Of14-4 TaxID=2724878 RepID=UPI001EF38453|nr:substrate-binding domain-containing protein [Vibrio sp. Of14-4]MCG7488298.1 substrate-binding domain-containing protein [Vibrio sp. Of14-4]
MMMKLLTVLPVILALASFSVKAETIAVAGSTTIKPIFDHLNYVLRQGKVSLPAEEVKSIDAINQALGPDQLAQIKQHFNSYVFNVRPGGSSKGVKSAFDNQVDIGMASRALKEKESPLKSSLDVVSIGSDALVFMVSTTNSVDNIPLNSLSQAFSGQIKTWEELGTTGGKIRLLGKGSHHGTHDVFLAKLNLKGKKLAPITYFEDELTITKSIAQRFKNGLAFGSLGAIPNNALGQTVKLVSVDGVAPMVDGQFNSQYGYV